jgi:hypothetical protein
MRWQDWATLGCLGFTIVCLTASIIVGWRR